MISISLSNFLYLGIFLCIGVILFFWIKAILTKPEYYTKYNLRFYRCSECGHIYLEERQVYRCPKCGETDRFSKS